MTTVGWYNTGTVTATNGSANVTGSGTAWLANVNPGQGILLDDGLHQILTVTADAAITIQPNYTGSTGSAKTYQVVPVQGYLVALANQVAAQANGVAAITSLAPSSGDYFQWLGSPAVPANRNAIQVFTDLSNKLTEVSVASAATADLGAALSPKVQITGTTPITSFGSGANCIRWLRFAGACLLTYNATSLILPGGGNITTAAGDTALAFSDASGNWRVVQYTRTNGTALFSSFVNPVTVTSASANALAVGAAGTTNPALNVDASTASSATGLNVKSAAAGGGLALSVISSGTNENLTLDAKGSGTITLAGTSTGAVQIGGAAGSLNVGLGGTGTNTGGIIANGGSGSIGSSHYGYIFVGRLNSVDQFYLTTSGFIQSDASTDIALQAQSGKAIRLYANGHASPDLSIGTDGSVLVGTTTNGGWNGNAKIEAKGVSQIGVSGYVTGAGGNALAANVGSSASNLVGLFFAGSSVGTISTNGTATAYNTTSTEQVKDNIIQLDAALALKVVRAYEPKTYVEKTTKQTAHGFVVEHFHKNMQGIGIDAHALGLVHIPDAAAAKRGALPGMDYGKATPFLASLAINHEDRIAALESELETLKAQRKAA